MPYIQFTVKYFIEVQDYTIIFQDNKYNNLLEKKGKFSNSKIMKHIKAQYFFIKDKFMGGNMKVK